jgi:hypothetical protein
VAGASDLRICEGRAYLTRSKTAPGEARAAHGHAVAAGGTASPATSAAWGRAGGGGRRRHRVCGPPCTNNPSDPAAAASTAASSPSSQRRLYEAPVATGNHIRGAKPTPPLFRPILGTPTPGGTNAGVIKRKTSGGDGRRDGFRSSQVAVPGVGGSVYRRARPPGLRGGERQLGHRGAGSPTPSAGEKAADAMRSAGGRVLAAPES